jgi:hypothetical protein
MKDKLGTSLFILLLLLLLIIIIMVKLSPEYFFRFGSNQIIFGNINFYFLIKKH